VKRGISPSLYCRGSLEKKNHAMESLATKARAEWSTSDVTSESPGLSVGSGEDIPRMAL
jgi:hypothetical protein